MPAPVPDDLRDLLALQLVPGLGPRRTAALLSHFGSAGRARRERRRVAGRAVHRAEARRGDRQPHSRCRRGRRGGPHGEGRCPPTRARFARVPARRRRDHRPAASSLPARHPDRSRRQRRRGGRLAPRHRLRQAHGGADRQRPGPGRRHGRERPGPRYRRRRPQGGPGGRRPDAGGTGRRSEPALPARARRPRRRRGRVRRPADRGEHGAGADGPALPGPQPHHQR